MADEEILSLDEPYPNVVIDRLRRATKKAIDDLAVTASDTSVLRLLVSALQSLSADYLSALSTSLAERAELAGRIAELEQTVTDLQAQRPAPTDPDLSPPAPAAP